MSANKGNTGLKILLALAVIGAGAYFALARLRADIEVAEVRLGPAADAVPGSVTVFADRGLQELTIEGAGRVVECTRLDPGATFAKGDVLLRLDDSDIRREMAELKRTYDNSRELAKLRNHLDADKALAEQDLDNTRQLQELGHASMEEVKKAQRAVETSTTAIAVEAFLDRKGKEDFDQKQEADEERCKKMIVVAPANGMVEGAKVSVGMLVSSGAVVATFYANERVVIAKVGEEDIAKVKIADPAKITLLTYPGKDFAAKVTKILPFADPETHRYNVYLQVEAETAQLAPNSTGEVVITVGSHDNVPLVPRRAVFNGSKGSAVFVLEGGKIVERQVEIGFRGLNRVEIIKGLKPGEKVAIVEDIDLYHDGQAVNPKVVSW